MLVRALDGLDPAVSLVNLSLGYFTQDDLPPLPVVNRITGYGGKVVVVASAGNSATTRPSWPAALPDVVAVAAVTLDPISGVPVPAGYSNWGGWVDACALGTWTSTYVKGVLDLAGTVPVAFAGFAAWEGTSFAAPYVAGRLAALMSARGISAAQAREELLTWPVWRSGYGALVE
jgi:subtilisin family serine protease